MPTPPQKVSKKSEFLADKFYDWSDKISQINFINGQIKLVRQILQFNRSSLL